MPRIQFQYTTHLFQKLGHKLVSIFSSKTQTNLLILTPDTIDETTQRHTPKKSQAHHHSKQQKDTDKFSPPKVVKLRIKSLKHSLLNGIHQRDTKFDNSSKFIQFPKLISIFWLQLHKLQ